MAALKWTPKEEVGRDELFRLGHFHPSFDGSAPWNEVVKLDRKSRPFRDAVTSFQSFADLHQDQKFGDVTVTSLLRGVNGAGEYRICDCPDIEAMVEVTEESRIANGTVTIPSPEKPFVFGRNFDHAPGMDRAGTDQAYREAFQNWNDSCGVNLQVGDYEEADVYQYLQGLGGGTLAIALLSQGRRGRHVMWQKYDSSNQRWNLAKLRAVIIHETGHTMGYSHSNSGTSIMRPYMNSAITVIQDADMRRFQRDYGQPLGLTPDVPDVPGNPDLPPVTPEDGLLQVNGTMTIGTRVAVWTGTGKYIGR